MLAVLLFGFRDYQKIVYIRVSEIETSRDFVNKPLTRLRGISKPKHHVGCLEKAEGCRNRGFFISDGRRAPNLS